MYSTDDSLRISFKNFIPARKETQIIFLGHQFNYNKVGLYDIKSKKIIWEKELINLEFANVSEYEDIVGFVYNENHRIIVNINTGETIYSKDNGMKMIDFTFSNISTMICIDNINNNTQIEKWNYTNGSSIITAIPKEYNRVVHKWNEVFLLYSSIGGYCVINNGSNIETYNLPQERISTAIYRFTSDKSILIGRLYDNVLLYDTNNNYNEISRFKKGGYPLGIATYKNILVSSNWKGYFDITDIESSTYDVIQNEQLGKYLPRSVSPRAGVGESNFYEQKVYMSINGKYIFYNYYNDIEKINITYTRDSQYDEVDVEDLFGDVKNAAKIF